MLHARALSLESGEKTEEGGVNGGSYERAKAMNKKKRSEKMYTKRENHKRLKFTLRNYDPSTYSGIRFIRSPMGQIKFGCINE